MMPDCCGQPMERCVNAEKKTTIAVWCTVCGDWENLWTGARGTDPVLRCSDDRSTADPDLSRGRYGLAITADIRVGSDRHTDGPQREGDE